LPHPGDPERHGTRFKIRLLFGALLLLIPILHGGQLREMAERRQFGDFDMYWFPASLSREVPGTDVYLSRGEIESNRRSQRFLGVDASRSPIGIDDRLYVPNSSTPFLFSLLAVLSSGNITTDYLLFQLISTFAFLAALLACFRAWDYPAWAVATVTLAVAMFFHPYRSDLATASPSRLLVACVIGAAGCLARDSRAGRLSGGAILGIAAMVKPIVLLAPAYLLLVRLRQRRWYRLADEGAGFFAAVAVAFVFAAFHFRSFDIWLSWAGRLRALPLEALKVTDGNFSLPALLQVVTGHDLSGSYPAIATALSIGVLVLSAGPHAPADSQERSRRDYLVLALGCLAFPLVSPRSWVHYYLLALPLLVALLSRIGRNRTVSRRRVLAILAASMLSAVPIAETIGIGYDDRVVTALGFIVWSGALLAWILGMMEFSSERA
jgi:hypothetical protein